MYPCCRYSGGHLDACLEIVEKYHPNAEDIEKIEIRSSNHHAPAGEPCKWAPRNIVDLQFSMPYQAAIAFKNGKFTVDELNTDYINDELVKRLIAATTVTMDDEFERRYPAHYSSAVTITMKDGTQYSATVDDRKGDWRNPVTYEDVVNKFRYLANCTYKGDTGAHREDCGLREPPGGAAGYGEADGACERSEISVACTALLRRAVRGPPARMGRTARGRKDAACHREM